MEERRKESAGGERKSAEGCLGLGRVGLAGPLGGLDEVLEGGLGLLPGARLKTAVRVDVEQVRGDESEVGLQALLDLLGRGDTRRVDVVDTGADAVGVGVLLEDVKELEVALRGLDRDRV
jgi:hypothetical protein